MSVCSMYRTTSQRQLKYYRFPDHALCFVLVIDHSSARYEIHDYSICLYGKIEPSVEASKIELILSR